MSENTTPQPNPVSEQQRFSDQEQHYKSLIELFKYCVTFVGGIFTLIGLVVGYLTYKDGAEMRADRKEARQEIKDNLKDMKDEIREERGRMEQKSTQARQEFAERERELLTKQAELEGSVGRLIVSTGREVANTKGEALRQIAGVKREATTIARSEAKNSITEVFKEKNLEPFIETVAKEKLGPKIQTLVDQQFKDFGKNLEGQVNDAQLLSQVTGGIMNTQTAYDIIMLDSLSRFSKNASIRQSAKDNIPYYYNLTNKEELEKFNAKYYQLTGDSLTREYFKQYAPKYATRPLPKESTIIKVIFEITKNIRSPFEAVGSGIALFNRLTGKLVNELDYETLEKEYADYQKKPYPLKMGKR